MAARDDSQVKSLTRILVKLVPPARTVAGAWAEKLYDHGVRVHADLATEKMAEPREITPEVRRAAEDASMRVLGEMAKQFPHLAPLVAQIESSQSNEERAELLTQLRDKLQPEAMIGAQQQIGSLGDHTE